MSSIQTDLMGAQLEVRSALGLKVHAAGVCRAMGYLESGSLMIAVVDSEGVLRTFNINDGYQVHVVPVDNPLTRHCDRCDAAIGMGCLVMADGYYHDARKAPRST